MIKNSNLIKIVNCKNKVYDFQNNLESNHTLLIKNCSNINIFANSKINKIIVINSKFINLNVFQLVSGIEIDKSTVLVSPTDNYSIPIIELFKSTLYLVGNINKYLNLLVLNEFSDIFNVTN